VTIAAEVLFLPNGSTLRETGTNLLDRAAAQLRETPSRRLRILATVVAPEPNAEGAVAPLELASDRTRAVEDYLRQKVPVEQMPMVFRAAKGSDRRVLPLRQGERPGRNTVSIVMVE
jgi:outer membrane protein OmpA-like peptidoglycan-associated protein